MWHTSETRLLAVWETENKVAGRAPLRLLAAISAALN